MPDGRREFLAGKVVLFPGDCRDVLRTLEDNSVDSVVTDPPYHLTSIVKRFGNGNAAPAQFGKDGAFARASRGFMGKQWDGGDVAFQTELWAEVLRVSKPGGYICAFGGTRSAHRMVCAIEDSGFEIRDTLIYAFGSGFPKSHNIGNGWGTALKPTYEPICLARKPLSESSIKANVLRWGTGALNIDGCRVGDTVETWPASRSYAPGQKCPGHSGNTQSTGAPPNGRWPANLILSWPADEYELREDVTDEQKRELFRWFHDNT